MHMDFFNEIVELYVYLDLTESCGIAKMPTLKATIYHWYEDPFVP